MTRHLLKLVWHRKRANALVMAEIFFSFLVVFAVLTAGISILARWNDPLGYDWHDVWDVQFDEHHVDSTRQGSGDTDVQDEPEFRAVMKKVLEEVKRDPHVIDAALCMTPPFGNGTYSGTWTMDGRRIELTRDEVTDGFANTMRVPLLRGRWFQPADDAAGFVPVVIDTDLAKVRFGDQDPLGQRFDDNNRVPTRVIGIIAPYRKDGELSRAGLNMALFRSSIEQPGFIGRNVLIRVRPGTPAQLEESLAKRLHAIAPDAAFRIRRMDAMRTLTLRSRLAPVILLGVVALFLISMVALGLTGVLWQSVTRRTRELGLRRALGATGPGVRRQVLFEVALLSTLAVSLGVVIVLQLPILGVLRYVSANAFASGIVSALVVIYAITLLCAAYPSWLASTVEPAEALRYE